MDRRLNSGMRLWILGWTACLLLVLSHCIWGTVHIPLGEWMLGNANDVHRAILLEVRIPRALTAVAAGAGLGLCGLLLQTWFANPLAGPSVLGVSSGAGLGVAVAILTGLAGGWALSVGSAILGSGMVLLAVLMVSFRFRSAGSLLIFGLMLNYVIGALITVMQAEADQDALQQFVFWGMGTFGQSTPRIAVLLLSVVGVGGWAAWRIRPNLDAWTLGELTARSMGVADGVFRWQIIGITGVVTGLITAVCGPVAFLGLATPHLVRLFSKERSHASLIPMTMLAGAVIALSADWGVKGILWMDSGWPLNAVLSLLGGPMVIWVLVKQGTTAS